MQHRLPTPDSGQEVIEVRFVHPSDALAEYRFEKIMLMPPQHYILTTLEDRTPTATPHFFFVTQWWSDDPAVAIHRQLFGACSVRCVGCNKHRPRHAVRGLDVAAVGHVQAKPGAAIKRPSLALVEPPAVLWLYLHSAALDDIPGIAYVLDTLVGVDGLCVSDHTLFCVLEWAGMEAVQTQCELCKY